MICFKQVPTEYTSTTLFTILKSSDLRLVMLMHIIAEIQCHLGIVEKQLK